MKRRIGMTLAAAAMAATLAGCETTGAMPTEVTRFHLGAPLERGAIVIDAAPGLAATSLDFQAYGDAVRAEVLRNGFTAAPAGTPGQYLATVGVARTTRQGPPRSSGLSIGLGGGSYSGGYGGGVGIGGGVSFPIGKRHLRELIVTDLSVQIRRRSDSTVIWEGRAQTAADSGAREAQPDAVARKLAGALFQGFPGESGRTITVK